MTYPTPSRRYKETVCTGGITRSGEWVRLYPIDYRYLKPDQKFHKYQWIELDLFSKGAKGDFRPESRRPILESIKIKGEPMPTKGNWSARREIVDKVPRFTLNQLKNLYDTKRTSMGLVKPTRILDLKITKDSGDWTESQKAYINQINAFDISPKELRKIPFKFQYVFECEDSQKSHFALITAWELGALFIRESKRLGSDDMAAKSVKDTFLHKICASDRDTRFFMGTVYPHNTWIVIGVFWPPKILQTELF